MTIAIPTNEPSELRAGLTWAWRREDLGDFPAGTYTLKYWFKKSGATGANFSITATADGANHSVSVAAGTTQGYTAGAYTWVAVATAGSEAYEVDKGTLQILPRYDQVANLDDRSHTRKMVDAIEALMEGRATVDQMQYQINGRMLTRMSIGDLITWRDKYRAEVNAEKQAEAIANGLATKNRILVRFR